MLGSHHRRWRRRCASPSFVSGKALRAAKALLPQGEYANWLDVEFDLSDRMAQRFVNVYERIGTKSDIMSDLAFDHDFCGTGLHIVQDVA